MKYIIKQGSDLFNKLKELQAKMKEVIEAQQKFLSQFGEKIEYYPRWHCIAGGVDGICFNKNPDPKLWKKFDRDGYTPKKSAKKLYEEMNSLPVVTNNEFNDLIGFKKAFLGKRVLFRPAVKFEDDYVLVSVDTEVNYTPVEGMEEILDSEYKELVK
jgi:hypothetical protein